MVVNNKAKPRKTFLQRLRDDTAGNVMMIVAFILPAAMGIIGGGVDASRGYMVKIRLQQACDAAVLAGRKAVGEGTFDSNAETIANNLFAANFPDDYQGATNTVFDASPALNDDGVTLNHEIIEGTATAEVPTVMMFLFGYENITLSATCNALLSVSNTDVTMVLDTTGSMNSNISDGNGGTTTRIAALRGAMINFHDILDDASANSQARIRYGLMPYSGTVNVGRLLLNEDPSYLVSGTHSYQSRRAVYEVTSGGSSSTTSQKFTHTDGSRAYLTNGSCNSYGNNQSFGYYTVVFPYAYYWWHTQSPSGNPITISGVEYSYQRTGWSSGYSFGDGTQILECTRSVTATDGGTPTETYDGTLPGATFLRWEYTQIDWPVADYIASIDGGTNVSIPSNLATDATTASWAGCIEERQTVSDATFAYDSGTEEITPSGATDLDIDGDPISDATRWKPYWPEVAYFRSSNVTTASSGTGSQTACPQAAQLLTEMSQAEITAYANSLTPDGGTYHDIGALWGARISSPDGIFEDNVTEAAPNSGFVSRNLIFMTDGILDTGDTYYSAYGVDYHDRRISDDGTETQAEARHTSRFLAICDAIRAKGIRLWVVAFATSLSDDLNACASANSAFTSTNAAELNENFADIAESIADLRLSE